MRIVQVHCVYFSMRAKYATQKLPSIFQRHDWGCVDLLAGALTDYIIHQFGGSGVVCLLLYVRCASEMPCYEFIDSRKLRSLYVIGAHDKFPVVVVVVVRSARTVAASATAAAATVGWAVT